MFRALFAFACVLASVQGASVPRPLADVAVPVSSGKKISLSQYKGKVMLVVLISTTCEHCIDSVKMIGQLQKEYGPRGFQAFAVAADDMAQAKIESITRLGLGFPIGYLDQDTTMRLCDFKRDDHPFVPIFMFVDKKGMVRYQYADKEDFFKNEEKNTRYFIEALLKN